MEDVGAWAGKQQSELMHISVALAFISLNIHLSDNDKMKMFIDS